MKRRKAGRQAGRKRAAAMKRQDKAGVGRGGEDSSSGSLDSCGRASALREGGHQKGYGTSGTARRAERTRLERQCRTKD